MDRFPNWKFTNRATERTENGKRQYTIDGRKYVSVTTMLSATADKSFLFEWRKRVGDEQANKITRESANRGTKLHKAVENYFLYQKEEMSPYFFQIRPLLRKIRPVCFESVLYSDVLGVAGRVDCIGYYDGVLSILDFKTSRQIKKKEWITDYFLQCCCYSMCIENMFGDKVNQLAILMVTEDEKKEFIVDRKEYIPTLADRLTKYRNLTMEKSNALDQESQETN